MAGKHELEKFEYLFVDIEWNQTPGTNGIEDREPIQIGVVATYESMNLKKSFSRAMRLSSEEKYNPDTLVLSHSTLKSVMQANSEEIVLHKIKMSFPKYKYVVVWTKDTYEFGVALNYEAVGRAVRGVTKSRTCSIELDDAWADDIAEYHEKAGKR